MLVSILLMMVEDERLGPAPERLATHFLGLGLGLRPSEAARADRARSLVAAHSREAADATHVVGTRRLAQLEVGGAEGAWSRAGGRRRLREEGGHVARARGHHALARVHQVQAVPQLVHQRPQRRREAPPIGATAE